MLTLTVWKSLQSLYRFTSSGRHKQALRERNKWIGPHQEKQPTYVVWWTEQVKDVSWEEAFKRYNYYFQHGSTHLRLTVSTHLMKLGRCSWLSSRGQLTCFRIGSGNSPPHYFASAPLI
ncbi:DUF3291 domain-containing protein [Bacillus sp. T33-2]|uniref:DUF3291 domain-containing protein n=1 Tax=Bacillus sp. T33-2 TaxID=2054168 RepID=UPI0021551991|nr:DUF3291 domain-containing protein [Bacillus sp. T33-2]